MLADYLCKTRKIATVLLLMMMAMGATACLSDSAPLDHAYASLLGDRDVSPAHAMLELHCATVVLFTVIVLVLMPLSILYADPLALHCTPRTLPLFRPPEHATR